MSFFAKSKTAEKMLKDFEAKIEKANQLISKLKKELSAIRTAKNTAAQEAKATTEEGSEEKTEE